MNLHDLVYWPLLLAVQVFVITSCYDTSPTVLRGEFHASPILVEEPAVPTLVLAATNGEIRAFDANTGSIKWTQDLSAPDGQEPYLLATPVAVDGKLVVSYQTGAFGNSYGLRVPSEHLQQLFAISINKMSIFNGLCYFTA
jgi:outer membrane protein assembly factor BamB